MEYAIQKHKETNHFYDKYLPYEFHLRMVVQVAEDFWLKLNDGSLSLSFGDIINSCYGHDLIEDTRCSYNEVKEEYGERVADIIYALTNEKGRNRAERGNDKYYEGIRNTPGATFVKLCDRIANVQYSKMTKSRMFDMYSKENDKFIERIGNQYPEMNEYLINLFKE